MPPTYLHENRYAFVLGAVRAADRSAYEVDSPESAFERDVQRRLAAADQLLAGGRCGAALDAYRSLRGVIAAVLHPQILPGIGTKLDWVRLARTGVADAVIAASAQMLESTPPQGKGIPASLQVGTALSPEIGAVFAAVEHVGLTDQDQAVRVPLAEMERAVDTGDFAAAARAAATAAAQARDAELAGSLLHDQAVLQERSGQRTEAVQTMQRAIGAFDGAGSRESQLAAMSSLAAMQTRGGDGDGAQRTLSALEEVRQRFNVITIERPDSPAVLTQVEQNPDLLETVVRPANRPSVVVRPQVRVRGIDRFGVGGVGGVGGIGGADVPAGGAADDAAVDAGFAAVQLLSIDAFRARRSAKTLTLLGEAQQAVNVEVGANGAASLGAFYATLRDTVDLELLTGWFEHPTITVAYLGHILGWVLPMAIGDCHLALGAYEEAEAEYRTTLDHPYLNRAVESVTLWLRLAELYVEWGDRLYRDAGNVVADFAAAQARYELVLRLDDTLDGASPLYQPPIFADLAGRARTIVGDVLIGGGENVDNPRVAMVLARARLQLQKIANGLNFLGMSLQVPPFAFEHLQNLARYFAQHAAQVEQAYIQFRSSGENETLREQQMAQQASIATASVELEQRGVAEAREGADVAQAGLRYATVQRDNAQELQGRFAAVRSELQELDRLQAWASSTGGDEVTLNVTHATYYSADSKPRSHVLFDLANRRAQISHDMEAARLANEVEAANAYRDMATQQVQQAQARVAVAQQRVVVANLQAQYARENLAFLKGREFSATLWYELAREARRLSRRYLDMAIEVAVLMEKAYEAETGRDLRAVKLDYGLDETGGLLGADRLLADIDGFSLDFVRTRAKKAPMKQVLSLADQFPMAFDQLLRTGQARFETTLEHFDRRYPGFYLQKVKQVELLFLGLSGTEGVHGTLRNIGLSRFRRQDGSIVSQAYPADVMPLSDYDVRRDAVVFQLSQNELRLFENNGIATVWQLDVPRHSNTFDLGRILDVQLVLAYDGFFDPGLEQTVLATLPPSGSGARAFSLRLSAPDELFFLRGQGGAELVLDASLLPANQGQPVLRRYTLQARGPAAAGLRLRVDWRGLGDGHTFELGPDGVADGAAFAAPLGRTLFDTVAFTVQAADNPQLVAEGVLQLSGIEDLALFVEYDFTYPAVAV